MAMSKIEEKLSDLLVITAKIDQQTLDVCKKVDSLESDVRTLMKDYSDIVTQIELIKHNRDVSTIGNEVDSLKKDLSLIRSEQINISFQIENIKNISTTNKSRWEKILEAAYNISLAIITASIIYHYLGIRP